MNCLYCNNEHTGEYGSGKFCCKRCACGFSTKNKRKEINEKVSKKLSGRVGYSTSTPEGVLKRKATIIERYGGFSHSEDTKLKIKTSLKEAGIKKWEDKPFKDLPTFRKRDKLTEEQNNCCKICNNSEWLGNKIKLELDHINGDHNDNNKENLRLICPNCHSFTTNYRGKNIKKISRGIIPDDIFIEALKSTTSIRKALMKLNLSPYGGNYKRASNLQKQILDMAA